VASADHLKKSGDLEKKVLLVVTDGEDNASRESLEQALRRLQEQNGPTIYTIGLLSEEHGKRPVVPCAKWPRTPAASPSFPRT